MLKFFAVVIVLFQLMLVQQGQAQQAQLMPVPVRPIYPGESLKQSDFSMKLFSVSPALRTAYVFDQNQFVHMEAVRTLARGKPVLLKSIRSAEDVKKGQPTKALYSSDTIVIQGTLVPLSGGSVGEAIDARNPASGGVVRAVIVEGGTLLVLAK